jgi:predicted RNase H-like HicB family nuclease
LAKEAIELYIESLKKHGEVIPTEENTLESTIAIEAYA